MKQTLPTIEELGDALTAWLVLHRLDFRSAAGEIGISASTLCRVTHGLPMSAEHYRALVQKIYPTARFIIDTASEA